ncbi:hypothetical protein PCA10_13210 [Metapseudomonas resinovorans NBRC 106553]|uniref:Uncharacterized protein n=1 Tax=Metapseudomonas resinovorans NBRC 106553 TaxID=1245471 RepID=S6ANB3_METRE|nr:hypothetical protein PCA10_13210 [Pseudomonas resinovorans NBRC 106553]
MGIASLNPSYDLTRRLWLSYAKPNTVCQAWTACVGFRCARGTPPDPTYQGLRITLRAEPVGANSFAKGSAAAPVEPP